MEDRQTDDDFAVRLLATLRANSPRPDAPVGKLRVDVSRLYADFQHAGDARVEEADVGRDFRAFWVDAGTVPGRGVILFLHGGGFTVGSTRDHLGLCAGLARGSGARVLSVDYRLAPEHVFPAALEDALAAYRWLLREGYPPDAIVPAGISAGATLVLSLSIALREEGAPLPTAGVCMSPATDLLFPGDSVVRNNGKDWITAERVHSLRAIYCPGADPCDPLLSPRYADLRGLPKLLLQYGGNELLYDDIRAFAAKLAEAETPCVEQVWPGMFHCWQIFATQLRAGREAVDAAARFIGVALGERRG